MSALKSNLVVDDFKGLVCGNAHLGPWCTLVDTENLGVARTGLQQKCFVTSMMS